MENLYFLAIKNRLFYKSLVFKGKILNLIPLKLTGDCESRVCWKPNGNVGCLTDMSWQCCSNPEFENFHAKCEINGGIFTEDEDEQKCTCLFKRLRGKLWQMRALDD